MGNRTSSNPRRILIASANPLFGKGLRSLFQQRWGEAAEVVGLTTTMEQTLEVMEQSQPDLVIVDYDDRSIDRGRFLNRFVATERPMQVALVSLQGPGAVVVYDRRMLSATQAIQWLGDQHHDEPPSDSTNLDDRQLKE